MSLRGRFTGSEGREDAGTGIFASDDEELESRGTYEDPNLSTREVEVTTAQEDPDRFAEDGFAEDGSVGDGRSEEGGAQEVTLHEERLHAGTETFEAGRVRVRKEVETRHAQEVVERGVEHAETERVPVREGDSGEVETLPDGSVSIPVFEEQLVVEKRLVVSERVIVRKHTVVEEHVVEAELRKERVEVETEGDALEDETGRKR